MYSYPLIYIWAFRSDIFFEYRVDWIHINVDHDDVNDNDDNDDVGEYGDDSGRSDDDDDDDDDDGGGDGDCDDDNDRGYRDNSSSCN